MSDAVMLASVLAPVLDSLAKQLPATIERIGIIINHTTDAKTKLKLEARRCPVPC